MTTLLLELPPELYERLSQEAEEMGGSVQLVAQRLLEEQLGLAPAVSERERVTQALRNAGPLAELGQDMLERARKSTASLEEGQAALEACAGKPRSEIVIDIRGPKG